MTRRQILIGAGGLAALGAGAAWFGVARLRGAARDYDAAVAAMRAPLGADPQAVDLVRYAALAASGHNTQPWRFTIAPGSITLSPDLSRRTPVVDADDHHLYVSLGCAAENLALAAAAAGHGGDWAFDEAGAGRIVFTHRPSTPQASTLFDAIPHRQSTRSAYDGRPVPAADLVRLASAGTLPGVDLVLVDDQPRRDRIRDLILAGNSAQMGDPAFLRELKTWLRFSPAEALRAGDGLYGAASGNPALPAWLGPRAFDLFVTAGSENDKYAHHLATSSGLAVFVGAADDRAHWVRVGQACQRFALQATALGLKVAYVNQPVEVPNLRPALAELVGLPGRRPDIVMRFGYGPTLPYSARRPLETILS